MKSIRVFLVTVILSIITLFIFVAALKGYQSSMAEANRLFDKQLLDTATLIANLHTEKAVVRFHQHSTIAFQVWRHNELIASSDNAPEIKISSLEPGFGFNNFAGYRWRTVAYYNQLTEDWVLAAERTDLRDALAEEVILEAVWPVLLGLPVLGLLIWLIVSRGLRPLRKFADELGSKQADDLSPLTYHADYQELSQIGHSSNRLLMRLETSLLREKQFASDAAHELRTPISTLKVQLHNAEQNSTTDNKSIQELRDSTNRLGHIVEQILDLYRSSPDQFNANFKRIDLSALAQEMVAQKYPHFEKKNQQVEFSGEPCYLSGDHFALSTLLQNLLSNANKYTPIGSHINVSVHQPEDCIKLTIEDNGPGIPENERESVFQRFYRVGGDRHSTGERGCGLGLAIVKHIVELHDASITVTDSRFETGIAFTVSFPLIRSSGL